MKIADLDSARTKLSGIEAQIKDEYGDNPSREDRQEGEVRFKWSDAKAAVDKAAAEVTQLRSAVIAAASKDKDFKNWLAVQFETATQIVKSLGTGGSTGTLELPGLTLDLKATKPKDAQLAVRRWFRSFTGFDLDDRGLKELVGHRNNESVPMNGNIGPLPGGR